MTRVGPVSVSLEVSVMLACLKIAWMIGARQKHQHFQFRVLNTIEFRVNEVPKGPPKPDGG